MISGKLLWWMDGWITPSWNKSMRRGRGGEGERGRGGEGERGRGGEGERGRGGEGERGRGGEGERGRGEEGKRGRGGEGERGRGGEGERQGCGLIIYTGGYWERTLTRKEFVVNFAEPYQFNALVPDNQCVIVRKNETKEYASIPSLPSPFPSPALLHIT